MILRTPFGCLATLWTLGCGNRARGLRILAFLLCFTASTHAATYFLRGTASGSNTGADWNNAFTSLNGRTFASGDTIWVAGGYLPGFQVFGNGFTMKRADSSNPACTSVAGWNPSFDSQVQLSFPYYDFNWGIKAEGDNITFDGRVTNGWRIMMPIPSASPNQVYGFKVWGNNLTIKNFEITCPQLVAVGGNCGIFLGVNGANAGVMKTNVMIERNFIHGINACMFLGDSSYVTLRNNTLDQTIGNTTYHDNGAYIYTGNNYYIYNNIISRMNSSGIYPATVSWPSDNFYIYGNLFLNSPGGQMITLDPGGGVNLTQAFKYGANWFIYNNTFYNCFQPLRAYTPRFGGQNSSQGGFFANNILWNSGTPEYGAFTPSYNFGSGSVSGTGSISSGANPFVNPGAGDFHIVSTIAANYPRNKGTTLAAMYSPDMEGVSRLGNWSMGALEYPSSGNPGVLQFSTDAVSVNEESGSLTVTVQRVSGSTGAVAVNYATANGTATAGVNYTSTSGTKNWAGGDTTAQTFSIPLTDVNFIGTKTFTVTLSGATGGASLGTSTLTVTLNGSGVPPVPGTLQLSASTVSVSEESGSLTVTVQRVNGTDGIVGVNYATANGTAAAGSNYTATSGTKTWASGNGASQTFSVPILDANFTGTKTFTVTLSSVTGGATLGTSTLTVTINGSGTPPVPGTIQLSASAQSVSEEAGSLTVTIQRVGGTSGAVGVSYATANGTATAGVNYTATSGTKSWADGNATSQTFTIPILDVNFFGSKTFTVTLSSVIGGATLGTSVLTVTINGSGVLIPGTLQLSASAQSVSEESGTATVTIQRVGGSDGIVSVNYATANGTATSGVNYTAASGTKTWPNGNATAQTFTVTLTDTDFIGTKTFTITLSGITGGATLGTATQTVTINGSGIPGSPGAISLSVATSVSESAGSLTATVPRTGGSLGAVGVSYLTANGTAQAGVNYTATSGTLSWANGDSASKSFVIPILNQSMVGSKDFLVALTNVTGGATLGNAATTVNILGTGTNTACLLTGTVWEAESACTVTVPFVTTTAGGVTYVYSTTQTEPYTSSGKIVITFTNTTTADYYFQIRRLAPNSGANSIFAGFDSDPVDIVDLVPNSSSWTDQYLGFRGAASAEALVPPTVFNVTAGVHTLTLYSREAGAGIDRVSLVAIPSAPPPAILTLTSTNVPTTGQTIVYRKTNEFVGVTVSWTLPVTVTGVPYLQMTGGLRLDYSATVSATNTLFTGYVTSGKDTQQLDATNLVLNGGTIRNAGIDALLTLPAVNGSGSLGQSQLIVVDTVKPTVTIGSPSLNDNGTTATFQVTFTDLNLPGNPTTFETNILAVIYTGTLIVTPSIAGIPLTPTVAFDYASGSGSFTFSIGGGSAYDLAGNAASASGSSQSVAMPQTVAWYGTGQSVIEGGLLQLIVNRSGASTGTITVDYITQNGTATAPADYTATSGTLTFTPGTTSQTVSIATVDNLVYAANKYFNVYLRNPVGCAIVSPTNLLAVIIENERPPNIGATLNNATFNNANFQQ